MPKWEESLTVEPCLYWEDHEWMLSDCEECGEPVAVWKGAGSIPMQSLRYALRKAADLFPNRRVSLDSTGFHLVKKEA